MRPIWLNLNSFHATFTSLHLDLSHVLCVTCDCDKNLDIKLIIKTTRYKRDWEFSHLDCGSNIYHQIILMLILYIPFIFSKILIFSLIRNSFLLKWDASSRWSLSLHCPMRDSDEMTIGTTHPTLFAGHLNQLVIYSLWIVDWIFLVRDFLPDKFCSKIRS